MSAADARPMYIDGKWVRGHGDGIEVFDPGLGKARWTVERGGPAQVATAVAAARRAKMAGAWAMSTGQERARLLRAIAQRLGEVNGTVGELESMNSGTPIREVHADADLVPSLFRYYASVVEAASQKGDEHVGQHGSFIVREPVGVVAIIAPWNYPLWLASAKIAPALAAGCTVVVKPASATPISILELARVFDEVGAPPGIFNVVTGVGQDIGDALVTHPDVDKIAFTGGTAIGTRINELSAPLLKRLTLELGGRSANIVFADADIDQAVKGSVTAVYTNAGQVCSAGTRLLVESSIFERFVDRYVDLVRGISVGYQLDPTTEMGPLISAGHRDRVDAAVQAGIRSGARLLLGGKPALVDGFRDGYYYEPTILADASPESGIVRDEIFGPVVTVSRFEDEAEAVAVANDSEYGLAAGLWTSDESRWRRLSRELVTGIVFVNTYHSATIEVPWGGRKASGFGRELGVEGFREFQEVKSIVRDIGVAQA